MVVRKFNAASLDDIMEQLSPFTIGFDKVFDNINTVAELSNNYPPYNIIRENNEKFIIEFAAAGFSQDELTVTQVPEGNKLVIQGMQSKDDDRTFLHRGIGARNFTKTFALNQDVQVTGADFVDGMLQISLEHIVPEERQPKFIPIGNTSKKVLLQE